MPNVKRSAAKSGLNQEHHCCAQCGGRPVRHPVRHVVLDTDYGVCIDEEIATLVLAVNDAGIETSESCQGDPGIMAHIGFMSSDDLLKFLNCVSWFAEPADLVRVAAGAPENRGLNAENSWKTEVALVCQLLDGPPWPEHDAAVQLHKERTTMARNGYAAWIQYASVLFPRSDIGWLEAGFHKVRSAQLLIAGGPIPDIA